ncbi:MAG TPA: LL-diaminopimelate aminotransferase [Treponemataceae bacterium]|nr:LL-diaminopimelate aminotransferase [Treponemataceae bacterium]
MSFFTDRFARRIGGPAFGKSGEIFKFEAIKRAKRAAKLAHPDIELIDMGVGEPDEPAFPLACQALAAEASRTENRFYADNGIPEFKEAAARYLERVYSVSGLDPATQIMHGIGTKPVYSMLPLAFIDPGDVALVTVPGYPILGTHARYLGGEAYPLPLRAENGFLPDLDGIPPEVLSRAKLLYLNYPNNPTGACATEAFFRKVVDFAKRNRIVVVHDAAYAALVYGDAKPLSFLSVPGAMDIGLEVHSLSKSFNMTGWRLGFVAGNPEAIAAYAAVKDNVDSGQFRAIQKAGVEALAHPELTDAIAEKYSRRFDLLVAALRAAGFDAKKPSGSFYCYVRAPVAAGGHDRAAGVQNRAVCVQDRAAERARVTFSTAAEFSDWLIRERLVSTVPWDDAGPYVRFSVTFEAPTLADERRVIDELSRRLESARLEF